MKTNCCYISILIKGFILRQRLGCLKIFVLHICLFSCEQNTQLTNNSVFESINPKVSGIDFNNSLNYDEAFNVYLYKSFYNGSGVGLGDLNNDGLLDVFFCGNQVDNKCYLNLGDFKFRDITNIAGLSSSNVWSTGVSIIDINGDGWLDIYVCKAGKPKGNNRYNELFINQGISKSDSVPRFVESAAKYGIDNVGLSVHATFFDMDKDGDLDMYLLNNSILPSEIILDSRNGLRDKRDIGGGNKLYRNDGDFFTDISEQAGIYGSAIGYGLGVSVGDVNRDSWPDIYVSNDFFEKDYLYINNQDGSFKEMLEEMIPEISLGAMGVDMADMNNDGYLEIFVTEMLPKGDSRVKTKALFDNWDTYKFKEERGFHRQFPRNSFQLNNGKHRGKSSVSFSEISRMSGVEATDWSWGVLMADFNNNGYKEIFITNGIFKDLMDQDYLNFYSNSEEIKQTYREKGTIIKDLIDLITSVPLINPLFSYSSNMQYQEVSEEWGIGHPGFSTGSAYGDLDNDGDLDLVVSNINMAPFLYRNKTSENSNNHFLNVSLTSKTRNRFAIGSQVTLWVGEQQYFQELYPIRGSMSTVDNRLHFGLGAHDRIDSLEVIWPDGGRELMYDLPANQFLVIDQSKFMSSRKEDENLSLNKAPKLRDITEQVGINYVHKENDFVDFDVDKLLFHMISNEGPKLAVGDVNNDGQQDFYIGGAKGHSGALYLGTLNGRFTQTNTEVFKDDQGSEDTDAVFIDIENDGDLDLLVASGGYEFSSASYALADRIYINDGKGNFSKNPRIISNKIGSTSCISISDFDQDGDIDIFVGGRVVPLAYGIPADSYLLKNDGKGNFEDVTIEMIPDLQNFGMVTDACWLDFDNDGDEDLIICGEWMPITVFRNDNTCFIDVTDKVGLLDTNGFWNTITKVDLNNDGYMDLVVGNLGLNTQFKASKKKPVLMHINDFDKNGKIEHIISVFEDDKAYLIATKREVTSQMPYLLKKYLKYHDFKEQTVEDIFTTEQLASSLKLEVFETESMIFMNEKGHFLPKKLPFHAQLSPTYSILTIDVDEDGYQNIIMGGNQFRAKPKVGIYAGSYGTIIRSLGDNSLEVLGSDESGFFVEGEIRDIKIVTVNGEELILVARNNDKLKVFKKVE